MASKEFVLNGTINFVRAGMTKDGDSYQLIKVSGFTFFLPEEHRNGFKQGQEVQILGAYAGERYSKKSDTYTPQFDISRVTITADCPGCPGDEGKV